MSAWTQSVHGYLTDAASSRFRNQEVTILEEWEGRDNLLWRVRRGGNADAVVKMFADAGQARSRRQFSGQEQFAAAGLAPEPLWYDRYPHGLPRQILVYRWVDGDALQLADRHHSLALAEAAARVHCADTGAVQRFSPHPFNLLTFWQIWQAGEARLRGWVSSISAPLLTELLSMLSTAAHRRLDAALPLLGETAPAPIHGELAAENALFHRGQALLLDWEFFGLGDPAQEIARFLFYSGDDWAKDGQNEWWVFYRSGNTDPSLPDRVELYVRMLNFQAVTFLLDGIREGAMSTPSDADCEAHGAAEQYRSFLVDALTVALRRALEMWELPPLGGSDSALLADEIKQMMNFRMTEPQTSTSARN